MSCCALVAVVKLKDTGKFCMSIFAYVFFKCEKWEGTTIQTYMELNFMVFWCVPLFTLVDRYQHFKWMCSVNTHLHLKSWYILIYHAIECHTPQDLFGCSLLWEPAFWHSYVVTVSSLQIKSVQCIIRHRVLIRWGLSWIRCYLFNRWERMVWLWRGVRSVFSSMWDFLTIRWAIVCFVTISAYTNVMLQPKWGKFAVIRSLFGAGNGTVMSS